MVGSRSRISQNGLASPPNIVQIEEVTRPSRVRRKTRQTSHPRRFGGGWPDFGYARRCEETERATECPRPVESWGGDNGRARIGDAARSRSPGPPKCHHDLHVNVTQDFVYGYKDKRQEWCHMVLTRMSRLLYVLRHSQL
jgi:hypothetical protein